MATSVRLTQDVEHRLDVLAKETGRTKAFYLRKLIEDHLEDLEDAYMAEAVLERIKRGEEGTITLEEMKQSLGLES